MTRTVSLWIRVNGKFAHRSYQDSRHTCLKPQDGEYYLRYAGKWEAVGTDPLLALDAKAAKEKLLRDVERGGVPVAETLPHLSPQQPSRPTVAAAIAEYLADVKLTHKPRSYAAYNRQSETTSPQPGCGLQAEDAPGRRREDPGRGTRCHQRWSS